MKRRWFAVLIMIALCAGLALPATAADVFAFTERSITLFEGDTFVTELRREGAYDGDGEITYTASTKAVTVSEDGVITGEKKGNATVTATLKNGKITRRATMEVKVARRVQKVTLSTKNLTIYEPADEAVAGLLKEETEHQVIVLAAGKGVTLNTTCTPEDATNRRILYATTDAGVAKITNGRELRAVQSGECDLTVTSEQNPEISETFRVLVIQPVKKIQIQAESKTVSVGSELQLQAVCSPDNASIQNVVWSSRNTSVATVDANGLVTGLKRGSATIDAKATDGSNTSTYLTVTVTQPVTSASLKEDEVTVATNRTVQLNVTLLPKDANDRSVTWVSSDESIATVRNGQVTGRKAGDCTVTCISNSDPSVTATAHVHVIQRVTRIDFLNPANQSFHVNTSIQLEWVVSPDDASIKDVTLKSNNPNIASVDQNGVVTGLKRGSATITATATDGSNRQGSIRVNVSLPVEGVVMQRPVYYAQIGRPINVKANVLPSDANNQRVTWQIGDEYYAAVRSNGTNTGRVHGIKEGTTTVTAVTEDGGYTASAEVRVADYDGAVMVEDLQVTADNRIRIVLRNMSDLVIDKVYFRVECFNMWQTPIVCNEDGVSTFFEGQYPLELYPRERTEHGMFRFGAASYSEELGAVTLTITGWKDSEGFTWTIPEDAWMPREWYSRNLLPVTPAPIPAEEAGPGEVGGEPANG